MTQDPAVLPDVLLYRTRYCGYCHLAARLLGSLQIAFREIDVSGDPERREELARATGQRTVPQVFVGERWIGGYAELRELLLEGRAALLGASAEGGSEEAIVRAGAQPEEK